MKMRWSVMALGAAALLPVTAASAQEASAADKDEADRIAEIIVEGERRLERKEISKAVDHLTRRTGLFAGIARFETPLCVLVIGLGEPFDEKIAARIRENVQGIVPLDKRANCRPNAITIITADPEEMFSAIYHKRQFLIGAPAAREYSINTVKRQLREGEPAISWSVFGNVWTGANGALLAGQPAGGGFWGWQSAQMPASGGNMRASAVVLLNAKKLNGIHVNQLADFATVHLLGSPRTATNPSEAGVPTILSLFEDGPERAPQRLTTFDRAYLCGLYRIKQRGSNLAVNLVLNSRMKQNMIDVYDSECVRVGAPAE
jgi:hypothetical protein